MFGWFGKSEDQRKKVAPPPGYVPPGMPSGIANATGPQFPTQIEPPDWVRGYQPTLPAELQSNPLGQSPASVQNYEAGLPKAPPGMAGGQKPAWASGSGTAGQAAPSAPAAPGAAPAGQAPSDGIFGRGAGGDWEMFKHQDDMGRTIYDTRPRGSGDPSQIASRATTPGSGIMGLFEGLRGPPQATGTPPTGAASFTGLQGPRGGLQGPTQMPGAPSLDQTQIGGQAPAQAPAGQGSLGGLAQSGSPMDNFFKLIGGGGGGFF